MSQLNPLPETWKMTRYIPGISITRFASFLAWTGMVASIVFSLASLDIIFTPIALSFANVCRQSILWREDDVCGLLYGVGLSGLVINVGMFIYCFKLWKKISQKDMTGMRNFIKIGCYIMGGMELAVCTAGIVICLSFIVTMITYNTPIFVGVLIIPIIIFGIITVFVSLMIHGVRKSKHGLLNVNIIFKIVLFILFAIRAVIFILMTITSPIFDSIGYGPTPLIIAEVNLFLFYSFFYVYYNGYIVLQYNILLSDNASYAQMSMDGDSNDEFEEKTNSTMNLSI